MRGVCEQTSIKLHMAGQRGLTRHLVRRFTEDFQRTNGVLRARKVMRFRLPILAAAVGLQDQSAGTLCTKHALQLKLSTSVLNNWGKYFSPLLNNWGKIFFPNCSVPMERVLLISMGSRGDMEPFLALGEELKESGRLCFFFMEIM